MNRKDIIRLSRKAGFEADMFGRGIWDSSDFNRFATLAAEWGAKQEREACENLCESLAKEDECDEMAYRALRQAAELMRKRGKGKP